MNSPPRGRSTASRRAVIAALVKTKDTEAYIGQLAKTVGFPVTTTARILRWMEAQGWVESHWEDPPPSDRLARRYYRLTDQGAAAAREWLGKGNK